LSIFSITLSVAAASVTLDDDDLTSLCPVTTLRCGRPDFDVVAVADFDADVVVVIVAAVVAVFVSAIL
jgi:hypothetical protein